MSKATKKGWVTFASRASFMTQLRHEVQKSFSFLVFLFLLKETTHSGFFYCFASAKNSNFDLLYLCNRSTYQHKSHAILK